LHLAACGGHREMVDLLVAASAGRHVRDLSHDATPAEWARWWGHPDLGDYLERLQA
jgi:Ankyrin repeat